MQRLADSWRKIAPALAVLVAAAIVWIGARALAQRIAGPPGFDVTITDASGRVLAHERADRLITPEVAPTPPPGATLTAHATYLAREAGKYTWQLGCTNYCTLKVDGAIVHRPNPGRVAAKEQLLTPGLHDLEVTLPNADAAGGVAFAVRLPSAPWRSPLLGPGDVVALPRAQVAERIGAQPIVLLHVIVLLPFLLTLFTFVGAWLAIGAQRRQRVQAYLDELRREPLALTVLTSIVLALIILPMIAPLFAPGFYACHEEESYIVRLAEYKMSLLGGVPMGRWWPDPVLGRGYPFLCLYAPLLYITATPFLLLGINSLSTVKLISGALVVVGSIATYMTARRRASRPAALLAAGLFTYAPYLQTDLWVRADLAESLGFACFPLAIMALDRILDRRPPDAPPPYAAVAGFAIVLFALGACHNITAYFSTYFLTLWLILRVALRTTDRAGLLRAVAGGGLGLWLTISYAVPAIGDAHRVWMERVMTGYYYALGNFMPADKLLWNEPRWGTMRTSVGVPGTIALFSGLLAVLVRRPSSEKLRGQNPGARGLALYAGVNVFFALSLVTSPLGPWVVKNVPLAEYVQFPWRMFLFACSLAPLCAPAALDGFFKRERMRWIVSLLCVAAVMLELAPVYGPQAPLVRSHLDVQKFLRSLPTDYVTSMNEYLPKTVRRTVPPFGEVAHVVAGPAQLSALARSPGRYSADVDAQGDALVEFNAHWFNGWRATLDGHDVGIGPGHELDDGGLIRVRVPPGHHSIALAYGDTPLRLACDLFSLAGLLLTLVLLGLAARQKLVRYRRAQET